MNTILDQKGVIIGRHDSHQETTLTSIPITTITQPSLSSPSSSSLVTADILRSRVLDSGLTMKQAFLKFDLNGSGSIEKEEMKQVLTLFQIPFTNSELEDLFVKYDVNRDQRFQYGEFVRIIQSRT
jgi:Ca2+-binding EF-hand superfamily protein